MNCRPCFLGGQVEYGQKRPHRNYVTIYMRSSSPPVENVIDENKRKFGAG